MNILVYILLFSSFHSCFSQTVDPVNFVSDYKDIMPSCNAIARKFIRATFHEAGTFNKVDKTGGSDGSLQFELKFSENTGLESVVDFCKSFILKHPGVSFADTITFGGKFAVEICNGPLIHWDFGRLDAFTANPRRLIHPFANVSLTIDVFVNRMGFTKHETVALILGGHSTAKINGFWGFNKKVGFTDSTPEIMDTVIFKEIVKDNLENNIQIPSDKNLLQDSDMKNIIFEYSNNESLFKLHFKSAFDKLINLGSKFITKTISTTLATNSATFASDFKPVETNKNLNTPEPNGNNNSNDDLNDNANSSFKLQITYFFIFLNAFFIILC